ncbi:condensin subunit SMC2 [Sugiyamaella lignohabitans]|uniref:Condensin subunit SMC2 n=1 Tax=Sugiyamaella lignohabitans TaxID=796027 RepID=A0A167EUU2_9ASCO|nr:condensin subunit SMC2 [Sugiyamaella lignohabitans]ANB14486.1 condensin subunit SMC2 [Sugiyamaella lignohabitans]
MKVEEIIIDGFKSYATRTVISGWDASFNCITGLNGSGKSNILDAICFVLGITTMTTVRAQNLQDLIYKRGQAGVTRASVTILFDNSDKSNSPLGFEDQAQFSVTRQIVLGGTSKFLINGHRAQQQSVQQLFQSVQLNINNPNFLIMQGQITKVLNMKPAEILALIEEAAGTRMFEDRREKAIKTMTKKEKKVEEILNLLHDEIEPKLENLRNEKRTFIEYQQTLSSLERIEKMVVAHDYLKGSEKLLAHSQALEERKELLGNISASVDKLNSEIQNLEEELKRLRKTKEDQISKGGKFQALEKQYKGACQEVARIRTLLELKDSTLKEENEKRDELKSTLAEHESRLKKQSSQYSTIEKEYETVKAKHVRDNEEISRNEELLQSLQTGVSSKAGQETGYASQLQEVRTIVNNAKTTAAQAKVKQEHVEKLIKEDSAKVTKAQKQNQEMLNTLAGAEEYYNSLKSKLSQAGWDPETIKTLKTKEYELGEQIRSLDDEIESMRRKTSNIDFHYSKPSPTFRASSVRGLVAQLFSLDKSKYPQATAIEVCAGGRLFNVVVDNDVTAAQLLQNGKLKRRVTIIPLNKISSSRLSEERLSNAKKLAPGKVDLALNIVGYEADVFAAMEYVFGSTLICKDTATAQLVTFDPKVRAKSVTLDGDIYDPMGTLSGGSKSNSSGLLISLQQYNELSRLLKEKNEDLANVKEEIARENKLMAQFKDIKKELDLKEHEITLYKQQLESSPSALVLAKHEERVKELEELSLQISDANKQFEEGGIELSRIEKDMNEFKQNKGSKLGQLKAKVEKLRASYTQSEQVVKQKLEVFQTAQVEIEQLTDDVSTMKEQLEDKTNSIQDLAASIESINAQLKRAAQTESTYLQQLEAEKSALTGMDDELNTMEEIRDKKRKLVTEQGLESQKLRHEIENLSKEHESLQHAISGLDQKYEWIQDQKQHFGKIGTPYDFSHANVDQSRKQLRQLQERINGMKKTVNSKVMNMIESVEKKEESLKSMIQTIEKDKKKIEDTIVSLDNYKREALIKTWEKVSV